MQGELLKAYVFPVEIWSIITDHLEASAIKKLFHVGNRLLQATLRMSVHSLSFQTSESTGVNGTWHDSSLKLFPKLKTLEVIRHEDWLESSLSPSHFVNIPSVTKLNLQFRVNYRPAPQIQYNKLLTREILLSLPASNLTWLNLSNLVVHDEHVPLLPPNLTYLKIHQGVLRAESLRLLPPNLLHLVINIANITQMNNVTDIRLPSGLLTLVLGRSWEDIRSWDFLPSSLLHLEVWCSQSLNHYPSYLPQQLESLILPQATITYVEDKPFNFPPTITDLRIKKVEDGMALKFFSSLPPLLKTLHLAKSNVEPYMFRHIPPTVTDLSLCRLRQRHFPNGLENLSLPPRLVKFKLPGLKFSIEDLRTLPPTITTIHTSGVHQEEYTWQQTIEILGPALPNLQTWICPPLPFFRASERTHLIYFIDTSEKPTLLRSIGFTIARMNRGKTATWAGAFLALYFVYRRSHIILPAAPLAISKLLLRCSKGVFGFSLALLYALF